MSPRGSFPPLLGATVPASFPGGIWITVEAGVSWWPGGPGALVLPLSCGSLLGSAQAYPSVPSLEVSTGVWSHLVPWEMSMI